MVIDLLRIVFLNKKATRISVTKNYFADFSK